MTDSGKRGWGAFGLVLMGAAALFGCGAGAPSGEEAVSTDGILVCGETSEQERAAGAPPYEWYSAFAMNNKLRHFPDFAEFSGVSSVASCDDARHFYDRYVEYLDIHPRFDEHEPLPENRLPKVLPPENVELDSAWLDDEEIPKMLNGTGDRLSPVVGLTYTGPQGVTICTGYFIAKNWIVTAAHCLQTDPSWTPTQPEAAAKVHKWYEWMVSVAGPQGATVSARTFKYVLQYHDPRYAGFRNGQNYALPYDFALLYVLDTQDGRLPNNIPNPSGSDIPYLRLSLRKSLTSSSTVWGMGDPDPSTLMRGSLSGYTLTPVDTAQATFTTTVPGGTVPHLCRGDSGGPVVDRYDILDPSSGVPTPQYVAAATLSGSPSIAGGRTCADMSGDTVNWVRTDAERDWVGLTIADRYPFFACKEKASANSASNDYYECWGPPCQADADCSVGEACFRPGSVLSGCMGCASGGCDCIYGQCFKADP
jgi:hypothetical protein